MRKRLQKSECEPMKYMSKIEESTCRKLFTKGTPNVLTVLSQN